MELLSEAARRAGEIALRFFGKHPRSWLKDGKSPVSEADLEVDAYLIDALRSARPDYGWLSEETADTEDRLTRATIFVVDPIDGTRAFLAGGEEWTVSLAVVTDGRPVAGVVYCPVRQEMFVSGAGQGTTLNGASVRVSAQAEMRGARVAAPPSLLSDPLLLEAGIEPSDRLRSLAYRLTMVAAGRVDVAAARAHANDWDLAAADLLVQEAGGRLIDLSGQPRTYNQVSTRHPALLAAPLQLAEAARHILSRAVV